MGLLLQNVALTKRYLLHGYEHVDPDLPPRTTADKVKDAFEVDRVCEMPPSCLLILLAFLLLVIILRK